MITLNKQELEIVQAFSSANVPEQVIRDSNIKDLIHGMTAEQNTVQADSKRLERLRQEKKDGNFIGNWWNDRGDKVQDAQIDLNKSISRLTQKSSQLLIVNTAISKVLSDQQRILLNQQNILKHQTDTLEEQNNKILTQQNLLEKQQKDINQANKGLMEAKGLTQEQAQQLVGCVKLVKEAESRIDTTNQALKSSVEKSLHDSIEKFLKRLNIGFTEQEQRHANFEQKINSAFSTQSQQAQTKLEHIEIQSTQFKSTINEKLTSTGTALEKKREDFEKLLTGKFFTQSQHTQAELARFSSETVKFRTDIEQQLQEHIQSVSNKVTAQNVATQKLHETVKEAEVRIDAANQALRSSVEKSLHDSIEQHLIRLNSGFAEQEQQINSAFLDQSQATQAKLKNIEAQSTQLKSEINEKLASTSATFEQNQKAFEQQLTGKFFTQSQHTQAELARFSNETTELKISQQEQTKALEAQRESLGLSLQKIDADLRDKAEALKDTAAQLTTLQAEQKKGVSSNRLAIAGVTSLALVSLGWQVAQHFSLI